MKREWGITKLAAVTQQPILICQFPRDDRMFLEGPRNRKTLSLKNMENYIFPMIPALEDPRKEMMFWISGLSGTWSRIWSMLS